MEIVVLIDIGMGLFYMKLDVCGGGLVMIGIVIFIVVLSLFFDLYVDLKLFLLLKLMLFVNWNLYL